MVKIYVLDTNVLIQAPYAAECFEDNQVVLPMAVLEELDNLKKAEGERGVSARRAIRFLEQMRQRGDLLSGVELPGGGSCRVEKNYVDVQLPPELSERAVLFHLRGGIDYAVLSPRHRAMMAAMCFSLRRKPARQRSAEDQALLETYGKQVDFTDLSALAPIVREILRG